MSARIAGVVLRAGGAEHFLPASTAARIVPRPVVTAVPGSALGMALVEGRVVPVIDVGSEDGDLLLCDLDGDVVALRGVQVLSAGAYDGDGAGANVDGRRLSTFDVAAAVRGVAARGADSSG